jgi:hypothetical protein
VQQALSASPELSLDLDDHRTVAAICRALDGLPLAIELAASRCHLLTLAQIHEQLSRPLSIGERALRDLPDRQQTLHATIDWSYELLTASARAVLRGAGVFRGGFTPAALEAVIGRAPETDLAELREASLVRRQTDPGRFELLELVRAFAVGACRSTGESAELRARHRRYFADLVAPVSEGFDGWHGHWRAVRLAARRSRQPARRLRRRRRRGGSGLGHQAGARFTAVVDADRAAELGDQEALAVATTQLFGRAISARDRQEIRRLRPVLLGLIAAETSPRALGWVHYSLWADAYIDGRFQSAYTHACSSVDRAAEIGHEYMLVCALEARLLAGSTVSGEMSQPELAEVVERARRHGVHSVAVAALWFVARYAAGVDPESARRWLALAERIRAELDTGRLPEEALREETMEVLGITDLGALLVAATPLDPTTVLDDAAAWVASRSPTEIAPRALVALPASPTS